jgi:hypothetical protein
VKVVRFKFRARDSQGHILSLGEFSCGLLDGLEPICDIEIKNEWRGGEMS